MTPALPEAIYDETSGTWIDPTEYVAGVANSGDWGVGDIASALLQAGLALGDISQVISAVKNGGMVPAQQTQALGQELAWVQYQQQAERQRNTLLLIGALGLVAYFALRKN